MDRMISTFKNVSGAKDLGNLDLTLLVDALKESKIVDSHPPYCEEDLRNWGTSTGADILRLKSHRNDIVAHIQEAQLSYRDFEMLWGKVQNLLCNIALRCGDKFRTKISIEIDEMKTLPLQPRMVQELRTRYTYWCKQDIQHEIPSHLHEMLDWITTPEQNMRKVYPCPSCNMRCSTEGKLERHTRTSHGVKSFHVIGPWTDRNFDLHIRQFLRADSGAVGVLAGGSSGAAVGLVLGPPGAVVGTAIGGLVGLFSGRK